MSFNSDQLEILLSVFKRLAKALISLRVCAGWSESLLVAHTTLLEISCHGSNVDSSLELLFFSCSFFFSEDAVLSDIYFVYRNFWIFTRIHRFQLILSPYALDMSMHFSCVRSLISLSLLWSILFQKTIWSLIISSSMV